MPRNVSGVLMRRSISLLLLVPAIALAGTTGPTVDTMNKARAYTAYGPGYSPTVADAGSLRLEFDAGSNLADWKAATSMEVTFKLKETAITYGSGIVTDLDCSPDGVDDWFVAVTHDGTTTDVYASDLSGCDGDIGDIERDSGQVFVGAVFVAAGFGEILTGKYFGDCLATGLEAIYPGSSFTSADIDDLTIVVDLDADDMYAAVWVPGDTVGADQALAECKRSGNVNTRKLTWTN